MTTFQSLYESRCVQKGDKLVPVFWKPQQIEYSHLTLFADDTCIVAQDWGCESVVNKIISLGLCCEIPVGEFVRDAGKGDLPSDPILPTLLRSHVADEAAHDLGFRLARQAYPVNEFYLTAAEDIAKEWQGLDIHPIVPAAALEVGVFLASLGALRLFGGNSLSHMASQIAKDEYRHVAVNMAVMRSLNLEFTPTILRLIDETVAWIFTGLSIPSEETGMTVDGNFFRRASRELIHTGIAQDLDDLTVYTNHFCPFEISNSALYSRSI